MGTPARTNILLEVEAALNTISVAGGYNTDVTTVETMLRGRDDVQPGERPYLAFGPGKDTPQNFCFNEIRVEMPIYIVGIIAEANWTTRSAKLNLLIDDVIAAMFTDPTLNSNAVDLSLVSADTDEADPDAGETGGTIILEFKVVYYRTTSAS